MSASDFPRLRRLKKLALPCLLALLAAGCVSPDGLKNGGEISKVKVYLLDVKDKAQLKTVDKMLRNERSRRLHGAITPRELRARQGYYYTVFWSTENPGAPATVRFEYRQADTGDEVLVKEIEIAESKRNNVTEFSVIGEPYRTDGVVLSWKTSVFQQGFEIADYQSYLWE